MTGVILHVCTPYHASNGPLFSRRNGSSAAPIRETVGGIVHQAAQRNKGRAAVGYLRTQLFRHELMLGRLGLQDGQETLVVAVKK